LKVPALDLKAQHDPIRADILAALERVLDSQQFILGPEVDRLETRVAEYSSSRFGVGVSSGTDALLVALMALNVGAGDEVVTTPFSFFATAGTVARLGAVPVFVDIDPVTFNIDARQVEARMTSRTKAVLPVHLFGQCAEMKPLLELCGRLRVPVVEDAAQAIGAEYGDGRRAGSMGVIGCFSFYPSKNLGALGDAGMVVTSDEELSERLRTLRSHGAKPKYFHRFIGGNFRLDALQAAALNVKFDSLDGWTRARQEKAAHYETLFAARDLSDEISPPRAVHASSGHAHHHIFNQYVIRARERDRLKDFLREEGIATEIYYPRALHLQECFLYLGHREGDFPEAERAASDSLALPLYPEITEEQQAYVVSAIADFYARS